MITWSVYMYEFLYYFRWCKNTREQLFSDWVVLLEGQKDLVWKTLMENEQQCLHKTKTPFPRLCMAQSSIYFIQEIFIPTDQFYSHYISNFEYKSCHMNYIGMNFISLLINSVAILHPQGLSTFWVRTVWFHIWYRTVWTQNRVIPFDCISLFFLSLEKKFSIGAKLQIINHNSSIDNKADNL